MIPIPNPATEKKRRKKEGLLILVILSVVGVLTSVEMRMTGLGNSIPSANAVLIFILININLLLLLALLLLVFRNLAKLYYEKKSKLLGTGLKTKLVAAFITLSLLPTSVLFFFSIHFISSSLAFWFNAPVEQTLDNALEVGRALYRQMEASHLRLGKDAIDEIIVHEWLSPIQNEAALHHYLATLQKRFELDGVSLYRPDARRTHLFHSSNVTTKALAPLTSDQLMNIPQAHGTYSLTTPLRDGINGGELLKTVLAIPFTAKPESALGFLVITSVIPHSLFEALNTISQGVEAYQQLTLVKRPVAISTYIALSIVALLVVFCAIWFGFYLARSITIPIMKFVEGTQRIAQGDLDYVIDFKTNDELTILIDSFNSMTRELSRSKDMVESQNRAIEESRQYMEIVLENISAGVISVDTEGVITTINKAAETLLQIDGNVILNHHYKTVLQGEQLTLAENIEKKIPSHPTGDPISITVSIDGTPRYYSAHFNALQTDSGAPVGTVMVFDDMTEIEKAQRMVAWREVARRIAHEVKNPLTPIKLSAQRLKRKYAESINDDVFVQCTQTIVAHVDLIRNLVNEFSTFAKFPDSRPRPCRIEQILHESIALYNEGLELVTIRLTHPKDLPVLQLDPQQIKQAFINLIDNAVAATNQKGRIDINITHDIDIKVLRIVVADNGKGLSGHEKRKLFEPYFSTKKSGMGLGLAIVNSIISDHKGSIQVQDNTPSGAKFIIELPVES